MVNEKVTSQGSGLSRGNTRSYAQEKVKLEARERSHEIGSGLKSYEMLVDEQERGTTS